GLLLGAAAKVGVTGVDFPRAHVDFFHTLAHHRHRAGQAVLHATQCGVQHTDFVAGIHLYTLGHVAAGDTVKVLTGNDQLTDHGAPEDDANRHHQQEAEHHGDAHGHQRAVQSLLRLDEEGFANFCLTVVEIIHR